MNDELLKELLDMLREQQAHTAKLVETMAASNAAQTQVFQSWLDMFKPGATPLQSSTPDERALAKAEKELDEWEPMGFEMAQALLNGDDLPNG